MVSEKHRDAHRERTTGLLLSTAGLGLLITSFCLWISYIFVLQTSHVDVKVHNGQDKATTSSSTVIQGVAATTVAATPAPTPVSSAPDEEDHAGVFILHPEQHIHRDAKSIHLTWNVTQEKRAPDGVLKNVYLINGQFPGPLIEARSGDEIVVDVYNNLSKDEEEGVSIHWHGISMEGANEMDGVVGLTQCAIPRSQKFRYQFRISEEQSGTFWYHAHSGLQRADGLYGGLVVHKPVNEGSDLGDQSIYSYDKEQLLLVGDWYHWQGKQVLDWFENPDHFGLEPAPDSLLINGRGHYNCSMAVKARPVQCTDIPMPNIGLMDSDRVRLRVVHTGVSTGFAMGISNAAMKVITVDGGYAVSNSTPNARAIGVIYPGERVDVVLDRTMAADESSSSGKSSDRSQLTIEFDRTNMALHNFALNHTQSFDLQWIKTGNSDSSSTAEIQAHASIVETVNLADLTALKQLSGPAKTPEDIEKAVLYASMNIRSGAHNHPVGSINHTSWTVMDPSRPPLLSLNRETWKNETKQPVGTQDFYAPWFKNAADDKFVDLVLNNFDEKGHPFHLHGHEFYVLAKGQSSLFGGYNPFDLSPDAIAPSFNIDNPLRKDTIYIPSMGYAVLRTPLNNPGLWLLHCHVLWHQAVGMGIVLQVGDVGANAKAKSAQLCSG